MNEKEKMYTTIVSTAVWSITLIWAIGYTAVNETFSTPSDSDSIKKELWIPQYQNEEDYFAQRESTGSIENTEWKNAPEMVVNEEIFDKMPTVEDTLSKEEAEEKIDSLEWELPSEVNLDVTFFPQAPDWNWELPWKEACEESSIIQALHFVQDKQLDKETFKTEILWLVEKQEDIFWQYIDTDMKQTAELLEEYYDYSDYKIIDNPSIEDIKNELAQWNPIIAPFAWKKLWNSFFTNGGPRYHVLVIVWYNEEFFLTNDVWTSRGENFAYSYDTIMNSLHDFVPQSEWDITSWAKRILVLN